jgi:formylglycine-generating enzyme required for sulfatase activity
MSPEQASGERRVDARSDVYALGAVLFEMLVGEPPFTGPNVQAIVARIMATAPQSIRTVRPTIPPYVEAAVLAALAKTPADRPSSARAFVDRLVRPTGEHQARVPVRRWVIGAGVVVMAVLVAFLATRNGRGAAPVGMALVPSGTFRLFGGDCPRCLPARDVRLDSFYIDRTEVPVVAYARYVAAGNAPAPWTVRPADSLPATGILWTEAAGYCRWRDLRARLPTEEEWEAAARGSRGELYPWGSAWESGRANADNVRSGLTPVGAFPSGATAAGVLDLIGNAWEWTASAVQSQYVIRGGAVNSPGTVATGLYRASLPGAVPESLRLGSYGNTGFRCVRAVR